MVSFNICNNAPITKWSYRVSRYRCHILIINLNAWSHNVRNSTFGHVRRRRFRSDRAFCAVWSESSLGAFRMVNDGGFLHEYNEDSNQTARMCLYTYQKVRFLTSWLNSLWINDKRRTKGLCSIRESSHVLTMGRKIKPKTRMCLHTCQKVRFLTSWLNSLWIYDKRRIKDCVQYGNQVIF